MPRAAPPGTFLPVPHHHTRFPEMSDLRGTLGQTQSSLPRRSCPNSTPSLPTSSNLMEEPRVSLLPSRWVLKLQHQPVPGMRIVPEEEISQPVGGGGQGRQKQFSPRGRMRCSGPKRQPEVQAGHKVAPPCRADNETTWGPETRTGRVFILKGILK